MREFDTLQDAHELSPGRRVLAEGIRLTHFQVEYSRGGKGFLLADEAGLIR